MTDTRDGGVHTPTPWEAEPSAARGAWIKGADGEWVALSCGDTDERAVANAEFIARAVNAHDALVAACEAALEASEHSHMRAILRAALSRTKENGNG